jgi:hypothetical protein
MWDKKNTKNCYHQWIYVNYIINRHGEIYFLVRKILTILKRKFSKLRYELNPLILNRIIWNVQSHMVDSHDFGTLNEFDYSFYIFNKFTQNDRRWTSENIDDNSQRVKNSDYKQLYKLSWDKKRNLRNC